MFRIDNASAVGSLPAPQAAGTPGFFSRGDPTTGERPTVLSADWANMLQEEVISVLAAASLSPSKTDYGQLLAAIEALITAAATSISVNWANPGHFQIGPVIVKWGRGSTAGSSTTITFDTPFPNACLNVTASDSGTSPIAWAASSITASNFLLTGAGGAGAYTYIAIGR